MAYKILGHEVEADLFDPDVLAKLETAIDDTVTKVNETIEGEKASEGIRRQCQAVIDCIDTIFGEGSADVVFDGKTNLLKCLDAFEDICFIHEQMEAEIKKRQKAVLSRVSKASKKK